MNKILIKLYVPAVNQTFDVFVPVDLAVRELINDGTKQTNRGPIVSLWAPMGVHREAETDAEAEKEEDEETEKISL